MKDTPGSAAFRRSLQLFVVALGATALVGVPLAWAADRFADVPTTHPFHAHINAIAGAGITSGCGPAAYCPSDPVTRGAMAVFMQRGFGRIAHAATTGTQPTFAMGPSSWTDLATMAITTGGAAGGTGFVKLDASFTGGTDNLTGCPCAARFRIYRPSTGTRSFFHYIQVDSLASGLDEVGGPAGADSGAITWVASVPTNTTETFVLQAQIAGGTGTMTGYGRLTAIYSPFGSTGGST